MKLSNRVKAILMTAVLFAVLTTGVASAAPESGSQAKPHSFKAVIIGISSYSDNGIKACAGSAGDVQKITKVLTEAYGFQVKSLVNEKATKNEIINALNQLADLPSESSSMIIFLGRGEKDQLYDYTYWIPYDAKAGDVLTYIDNRQIAKQIKKIKSRHLVLISGANYAAGLSHPETAQEDNLKRFQGQSRWAIISNMNSDVPDAADPSSGVLGKAVFNSLKKNQAPLYSVNDFYKALQSGIPAKSGLKTSYGLIDSGQSQGGEFMFAKAEALAALVSGEAAAAISGDGTGNDAVLNINSSVTNADIYLNGIPWGKTPLKDKKVIVGKYSVKVQKDGYEPVQNEVVVAAGETKDVSVELLPSKSAEGSLKLNVTPQNAIVAFADGKTKYAPNVGLAPGKYQVEIKSFGYDPQKVEFEITPGAKLEKSVSLKEASVVQNSLGMKFVKILPGTFSMGSAPDVMNRGNDETVHNVKISKGFFIQATEVSLGQWNEFIKATSYKTDAERNGNGPWIWIGHKWEQDPSFSWKKPGFQQTDDSPVVCISWNDALKFIEWLNTKEEGKYRLPTEAEWEYAARSGSKDNFAFGQCISSKQANYDATALWGKCQTGSSLKSTAKTGSFPANAWGLFDVHGNALEWCSDWYGDYPSGGESVDPGGAKTGTNKVARGGAWDSYIYQCRSAKRFNFLPEDSYNNLGFRVIAE